MTIYHIDGTQIVSVIGPAKIDVVSDEAPVIAVVEAPTISALTPDTVALDDPDVDMVVTGTGFNEMSKIVFDGHDEPTKLLSATEVSTGIRPSLFTEAKSVPVTVRTGSMVGGPLPFTFTEAGAEADESKRSTKHHRRR